MTAPEHALHLRTLGPVGLTRPDGTEITSVLSQPKRLALLVYLAVANRGALCRRDSVLGVLWPEFDQERARAALRKALHFLRRELGDGVILTRGDEEIGVDPSRLTCDVNEFDTAASEGRLTACLETYAGEFLTGFHVGIVEFERWRDDVAEGLRREAVRAAGRLTIETMERGDTYAAARIAGVWTRLAPYDEAAAQALMSALDSTSDRAGALNGFDTLVHRLRELDLEPSAEMTEFASSIRNRSSPAAMPPLSPVDAGPRRRRALVGLGAAAGVGVVTIVTLAGFPRPDHGPTTVAVPEFANLTENPDLARLGPVYQRAVVDGLSGIPRVHVLPGGDGQAPDLTVGGYVHRVGDSVDLGVEIVDRAHRRTLPAPPPVRVAITDPAARLEDLQRRVMAAVDYYTSAWHPTDPRRRPPSWEAYHTFQQAVYVWRGWPWPRGGGDRVTTADSLLRRVIAIDPRYTEAYRFLGAFVLAQQRPGPRRAVYAQRGNYEAMDSLVHVMRMQVRPFTDLDEAVAEYLAANVRADYAAMLRWAWKLDDVFSAPGPHVVKPSGMGNRPGDVLRRFGPESYGDWAFDNWTIWFWALAAYHLAGDYEGEARAVDSGKVRTYVRLDWPLPEFRAQVALGHVDRVRELAANLDDGIAYFGGLELRAHGLERNDDAMLAESERLLRWFLDKSFDAANREWWRRVNSYGGLAALGRADELVATLDTLVRQQPPGSVGGADSRHLVDIKGMVGAAYARQGNRAAADSLDRELAAEDRSGLRGLVSLWRARIAAQLGHGERAVALLDQAFREGTWFQPNAPVDGGFWHTDPDFEPLRDYPPYQRLIAPKQ